MFLVSTEAELRNAFRPRDRKTLELLPGQRFPVVVREMFSWVDPTGVRVHVVIRDPASGKPLGMSFRRDASEKGASGSRMCDWCHGMGGPEGVGMLTCARSSKRVVGTLLCRDLGCADRAEDDAWRAGRNAKQARINVAERAWKFAHEGLGIDQVP